MTLIKRITNTIFPTLLMLLMLLTTTALFPAESQIGTRILVRSLPDRPVAGSTWTLTLLIAHNEPNEVEVLAPHFDEALFLEQVTKLPRLINPGMAAGTAADAETPPERLERWTAMEYRFALNSPGTISFDAFTVITPQGQTMTNPFVLNIQRPQNTAEVWNYKLVWEGTPSALKTGESAVFSLRYSGANNEGANYEGGNSARSLPKAGQLLPPVPPGYVLESLPLTPGELSAGIALKLRLIPLEESPFTLARRQFSHNGAIFEVPALRIPVSRAEQKTPPNNAATANNPNSERQPLSFGQPLSAEQPLPFPSLNAAIQSNPKLYQKHQIECGAVYAAAKNLWEDGRRAEAMAELRRAERDHPAGALFATVRREAEKALGLAGTNDEKRSLFKGKSRAAVLRETAVRRIPDMAGEEIARFREGQPALLNGKAAYKEWIQVTANDDSGAFGWVLEAMIIHY